MPESGCDHTEDAVNVYSDSVAEAAAFVEHGVLVEYSEDEAISICMTGIDDDCAAQLLRRALDHLQGV